MTELILGKAKHNEMFNQIELLKDSAKEVKVLLEVSKQTEGRLQMVIDIQNNDMKKQSIRISYYQKAMHEIADANGNGTVITMIVRELGRKMGQL